jgi:hypothetical protein
MIWGEKNKEENIPDEPEPDIVEQVIKKKDNVNLLDLVKFIISLAIGIAIGYLMFGLPHGGGY